MIIPEIKMSEALPGKSFDYYLEKIEPYDFVSINTSSDFGGHLDMLREAKEKYPDKEFLRKDFLVVPKQISESVKAGATDVLLLEEYLQRFQLERMMSQCYVEGIFPLVEVNSYKKLPDTMNPILVNSRDLNTGIIDRERAEKVCRMYKEDGKSIVFGSGENSDEVVRKNIANSVLIGTAFMNETMKE